MPEGHKVGDRYVATRDGKSVQWKRLYLPLMLKNEDEVVVFLVAHEPFTTFAGRGRCRDGTAR